MEARDEKRLLRLQRQLPAYKLLIVDELGYVPLSPTGAELLFEVFSQRYERGSTIVTSNLPFDDGHRVRLRAPDRRVPHDCLADGLGYADLVRDCLPPVGVVRRGWVIFIAVRLLGRTRRAARGTPRRRCGNTFAWRPCASSRALCFNPLSDGRLGKRR